MAMKSYEKKRRDYFYTVRKGRRELAPMNAPRVQEAEAAWQRLLDMRGERCTASNPILTIINDGTNV